MTGNPEESARARGDSRSAAPSDAVDRARSGPVVELALAAAALGLVIYLLGFVDDTASGTALTLVLLLGGGLLAGSVALPSVGARSLAPAAVATVTGFLLLFRAVVGGADSALAIFALVLALLEAAAAVGATLLHAGVVRAPRPRPKKQKAAAPPPQGYPPPQYPSFPGQQYPGQPYPGSYPGYPGEPYPADQYAGEHAYAQNARYGGQYGVPGYPPPPPGYDPAGRGAPVRADVPPVPGDDAPTTVAYRSGVPVAPAEASAAAPEASAAAPAQSSGAFRVPRTELPTSTGSHAAAPAGPVTTGSHAKPESADERPDERDDGDDDRTRAIPRVTDQL